MDTVRIVDNTLVNIKKSENIALSLQEKSKIVRLLDFMGADIIDIGPTVYKKQLAALPRINGMGLGFRITTWNVANFGDICASVNCGIKGVHISVPVSDILIGHRIGKSRQWVLDSVRNAIRCAADLGFGISVGAEGASEADWIFLVELALLAEEMGAERFRFVDSSGIMNPEITFNEMKYLVTLLNMDLEFQGGNKNGMAAANTAAAVLAGFEYAVTAVGAQEDSAVCADLKKFILTLKANPQLSLRLRFNVINMLEKYLTGVTYGRSTEGKDISSG
ncbi:MAG: homocitrate synthase [Bacillota bacterium]